MSYSIPPLGVLLLLSHQELPRWLPTFHAFTDISAISSGICCKGMFTFLFSLLSYLNLTCHVLWELLFSSVRCLFTTELFPARACLDLPFMPYGDFFLDLSVFFPSQSKYFTEVSSTAFLTAFRPPAGFLLLWTAPFGTFLSSFFAFLRLNIPLLNVFGPATWLSLIVPWSLLQSSSHKQLLNEVLRTTHDQIQEGNSSCGCKDQLF